MSDRTEAAATHWRWLALRVAMFLAGASLLAYIPYRYLAGAYPGDVGTLYGTIFPASSMLALAGILLALKPTACSCAGSKAVRLISAGGLTVFAGTWMFTGLQCTAYLTALTLEAPLRGLLATFHMTAQHIFLSLGVVALAWEPEAVARRLGLPAGASVDDLRAGPEPVREV